MSNVYDALVIGAGFLDFITHRLRDDLGLKVAVIKKGRVLVGHGIGTVTPAHDATVKVRDMRISFRVSYMKTGSGQKDIRDMLKSENI